MKPIRFLCLLLLAGCNASPDTAREHNPLDALPIDSARIKSVDESRAWKYKRSIEVDLNGDGEAERLVLAADAEVDAEGRGLWEDGHRWSLYVEGKNSASSLLYAAFVPNGFVEAAVLSADSEGNRRVLVLERSPHQVRALEVQYDSPSQGRLVSAAYYQLEQWLPGFATLR